jgi:elongator complex protein 3
MGKTYYIDINTYKDTLVSIIEELGNLDSSNETDVHKVFRKYPKDDNGLFRKSDIAYAFEKFDESGQISLDDEKTSKIKKILKMKETRTISGVTPVTVLTKPFPCPGKCIFCPNDVRMPKSYLSDEPGAQRATRNRFDPYAQTYNRLLAYKAMGHSTDKIELIILGGTWTSYPEAYQIWYVKRCFDAMNEFSQNTADEIYDNEPDTPFDEKSLEDVHGEKMDKTYNLVVSKALLPKREQAKTEDASWEELFEAQKINENGETRCVGLVIETRPDEINEAEIIRIRKLGATKTQIGFQSLNDKVLELNKRGHDVQTTRDAVNLLRKAGFKIHAHWMPNLFGSTPQLDIEDFQKMFTDGDFMPDELKIYPCSLIESAELMVYYKNGFWRAYTEEELLEVLKNVYKNTAEYCRITRMIRDIGSQDIVTGNKKTNLREMVERELAKENAKVKEIRYREIRNKKVKKDDLTIKIVEYETSVSNEYFLEYVTKENLIAGFLRLSLPKNRTEHFINELNGSAIIREVHIYGESVEIGNTDSAHAQHLGLGKTLIAKAEEISAKNDFTKISVISSIGTRNYYKKLGYELEDLYQTKKL